VSGEVTQDRTSGEDHPAPPKEKKETLWLLTLSPVVWALHFLLCYVTAAIWCARVVERGDPLGGVRWAIAGYTVLALAGIAVTGWRGWLRHRHGTAAVPHDFDSPADRHRFLGFATLLLSGLSAVAVLYVALAVVFIGSCR
jgi:hypothetical protein